MIQAEMEVSTAENEFANKDNKKSLQILSEKLKQMNDPNFFRIILLMIRHAWWIFLIVFVVIFSFLSWYLNKNVQYYASVRFGVNNWEQNISEVGMPAPTVSGSNLQVLQLFYSDEAINYLIDRFHLDINIQPGDSLERSRLTEILSKRIQINDYMFGSYELTVKSGSRELPAAMANALIDKVEELNKSEMRDYLEQKIEIIQSYFLSSQDSSRDVSGSDFRIQKLIQIESGINRNRTEDASINELRVQLNSLIDQLKTENSLFGLKMKSSQMALRALNSDRFNTIVLIRRATPHYNNYTIMFLLYSFAGAFFAIFFLPLPIYFVIRGTRESAYHRKDSVGL